MQSYLSLNSDTSSDSTSYPKTAPVSGFARSFLTSWPIKDATITILENGEKFKTDNNGRFGPFQWPVGKPVTLVLEKKGYRTTQSATVTVPPEGLNDPLHEISFQVPSNFAFTLFSYAMGVTIDENACQVTATVTAHNKTMDDIPQGEAGATAVLSPDLKITPFYFAIFESGPLKHKTNPFVRSLRRTTDDGGLGLGNVKPRSEPYTLIVTKPDTTFSEVKFIARPGIFINISPPQGPMVLEQKEVAQKQLNTINHQKPNQGWRQFGLYAITLTGAAIVAGTSAYMHYCSPK